MDHFGPITTVAEYHGEAVVKVSATQLGTGFTQRQAKKIVDEWCRFFAAGPSPIEDLSFVTRTPKRLLASLSTQVQLRALRVKWGDYQDLAALQGMSALSELWLGGASSVQSVEPLSRLRSVAVLCIESLRHAHDLSPLGEMTQLEQLELGGDWMSPRIAHVDSKGFLRGLPNLRHLELHTMIVDDLDYSPLLSLPPLSELRVMKARGMRPSFDELRAAIPVLN